MKKNCLFVLVIAFLFIVSGCKKTTGNDYSILWEVTGNGLEKPSYVFGILKSSSIELEPFFDNIDGFYPALNNVSQLIYESYIDFDNMDEYELDNYVKEIFSSDDITYQGLLTGKNSLKFDSVFGPLFEQGFEGNKSSLIKYHGFEKLLEFSMENQIESMENFIKKKFDNENGRIVGLEQISNYEFLDSYNSIIQRFFNSHYSNREEDEESFKEKYNLFMSGYEKNRLDQFYEDKDFIKKLLENGMMNILADLISNRNKIFLPYIHYLMQDQSSMLVTRVLDLFEEDGLIPELQKMGYTLRPLK